MKTISLVAFSILLAPSLASASPLFETMGPVGGDGGMNSSVAGASGASTYFNPALLSFADEGALFSFSLLSEQIGTTLDGRRAGADVPLSVGARDILGANGQPISNATVPTMWLNQGCEQGTRTGQCPAPAFTPRPRQQQGSSGTSHTYLTLGFVKHLIKDRFTIGAYAMLPITHLTTASTFYVDEREALFSNSLHPELYGDRLTAISISLAAAFRLLKNLSVGIGMSVGLTNTAASGTYIRDTADYNSLLINNQVGVSVAISPHLGVAYTPIKWLHFGGTVHAPQSFELDTTIGATLPSGQQSSATKSEVHDYLPWRASAGVQADVMERAHTSLGIVASVKWTEWSNYLDRHAASPGTYGADLGWHDTLTWAAGIRPRYKSMRTFLDMQYVPSPVPEQVGRSNYVDNDRIGMTAGADFTVDVGGTKLRPGVSLIGYRLIRRHNTKDDSRLTDELPDGSSFAGTRDPVPGSAGLQTNNPGWPGYASAGWIYGGSVTLEVLFK